MNDFSVSIAYSVYRLNSCDICALNLSVQVYYLLLNFVLSYSMCIAIRQKICNYIVTNYDSSRVKIVCFKILRRKYSWHCVLGVLGVIMKC